MVLKCEYCKNKKISSLFSHNCRCGLKQLCDNCRVAENHKCTFDYRKEGSKILTDQNPKIESQKLIKI